MRIVICDDERAVRDELADKAGRLYPSAEIAVYGSGEELLKEGGQPDILFLDIQMPGRDGMETARELRRRYKTMILVFVTAIEEYVFQAFDVGAFHYLVKPFTDGKFKEVLMAAAAEFEERAAVMKNVARILEREEKYVVVKTGGIHTKVFLKDIIYAEVYSRKIILHKTDGDMEYYGRMSELEKALGEDFFRPHRSYLVHFKYVVRYDASAVYMEKGSVLMAKQNYSEFVKRYLKYNQRQEKEL